MSESSLPTPPAPLGSQGDFRPNESNSSASALTPMAVPWVKEDRASDQGLPALPDARRFAALSTLPESRRMPLRRDVPLAKHLRQQQQSPPAAPDLSAHTLLPPEVPAVMLPSPESRLLGFNCPACFAVLIIKDPTSYDGYPAPCPTCGTRIQPPQCVPESPFSIVHRTAPVPVPPSQAMPESER